MDVSAAMDWLLGALAHTAELTLDEVESLYDPDGWDERWTPERELEDLKESPIALPFTVVDRTAVEPWHLRVTAVGSDEKRWCIEVWVQEAGPHKITGSRVLPAPPEGTVVRLATPDDKAELAELERRSPLRLGETAVFFDRGDDYFASARLMEEVTIYVAEVGGTLAGVYWGARQPVRIGGKPKVLFLEHHVRIDPATQRAGVFWALVNFGRDTYARNTDSIAFYVSPDNYGVRRFVEGTPSWSVQPVRALLRCPPEDEYGDRVGRAATPADAPLIAGILNDCHSRSELFVPYTAESLASRLSRDPDQYGWPHMRILGDAVVGVGRELLGVRRERDNEVVEERRALVLDHGFRPGSEDDYRRLLQLSARHTADAGATHLAVFTTPGSPTHPIVTEMAAALEPYDFWAFNFDDPPGLRTGGHYVDPIYF